MGFFANAFAQKEVLKIPVGYKSTFYDGKESLALSNPNTGELVLFIEDEQNSKAILLDKEFSVIGQLVIENLENSFKTFIGYQINADQSFSIYFTNKRKRKFGVLVLDFKTSESVQKKLEFKLTEEAYIEGVSHKNKFYLMSVTKSGSDVHFYSFKKLGVIDEKKTVDFSFLNEVGLNGFLKTAHSYLGSSFGNGSLVKVDANSPNAIEVTSNPNKFYFVNDDFVFSFDKKGKTLIAIVSPENEFNFSLKEFSKPVVKSTGLMNHNSYLHKKKIYQVVSTSKELILP